MSGPIMYFDYTGMTLYCERCGALIIELATPTTLGDLNSVAAAHTCTEPVEEVLL